MCGMWMGLPTQMAFAHNVQVMLNDFATCMMLIVPNIVSQKWLTPVDEASLCE